ncbi:MAG TPA: hypothetical protein VJQ45_09415 [Ktedonobacterales bacterium]|nr:hypothetical protein [Ktedonobacterales bacterium]
MRQRFVTPPLPSDPEPETPPLPPPTPAPSSALYQHTAHMHQPRNVNHVHHKEQDAAGFNTRVAVWMTKNVGTMQCAYVFAGIGIGSLVGVATGNVVLAALFGSISSYFLQLVLLPILSVGQNVLGRHQELQADEMFKTSLQSFHDIEEIKAHLAAQDEELLKHTRLLQQLAGKPAPEATQAEAGGAAAGLATPTTRARKGKPQ